MDIEGRSGTDRAGVYGPYRVGDRVWVAARITGVNNSDADWVIVERPGVVFTVDDASTSADLSLANAAPVQSPALPDQAEVTATKLRLALAFVEQVSDGAYGDLPGLDAQQVLDEIAGLDS